MSGVLDDFEWPMPMDRFVAVMNAVNREEGKVSLRFFSKAISTAMSEGGLTRKAAEAVATAAKQRENISLPHPQSPAHRSDSQQDEEVIESQPGSAGGKDASNESGTVESKEVPATPDSAADDTPGIVHYTEQLGRKWSPPGGEGQCENEGSDKTFVVIGPTHGHPTAVSHVVLQNLESQGLLGQPTSSATLEDVVSPKLHFVFLGDYVDGGLDSMTTLALVCLLISAQVGTALVGRNELLFPVNMMVTGTAGRFDEELRLSFLHHAAAQRRQEDAATHRNEECGGDADSDLGHLGGVPHQFSVRQFFLSLPLAAVINGKYFCICGGLTPKLDAISSFLSIPARSSPDSPRQCSQQEEDEVPTPVPTPGPTSVVSVAIDVDHAIQSVLSDPMDDDEEYQQNHNSTFRTSQERPEGFNFSFDAACQFLHESGMYTILRANCFVTNRGIPGTNNCGRPWHYQHSAFDPGYRMFRKMPETGIPSVISLFSAPHYCSANQNRGAYVVIPGRLYQANSKGGEGTVPKFLNVRQFVGPKREGQPVGIAANAFRWSLPLMASFLQSALNVMVHEEIPHPKPYALPVLEAPPMRPPITIADTFKSEREPAPQVLGIHHHRAGIVGADEAKLKRFQRMCLLMRQRNMNVAATLRDGYEHVAPVTRVPLAGSGPREGSSMPGHNTTISSLNVSDIEGVGEGERSVSMGSEALGHLVADEEEEPDDSFFTSSQQGAAGYDGSEGMTADDGSRSGGSSVAL